MMTENIDNQCGFYMCPGKCGHVLGVDKSYASFGNYNGVNTADCKPGKWSILFCQNEAERQTGTTNLETVINRIFAATEALKDQRHEEATRQEKAGCDWHDGSHDGQKCKRHPAYHYFSKCNLATRYQSNCCYDPDPKQGAEKPKEPENCAKTDCWLEYYPCSDSPDCPEFQLKPQDGKKGKQYCRGIPFCSQEANMVCKSDKFCEFAYPDQRLLPDRRENPQPPFYPISRHLLACGRRKKQSIGRRKGD